MIGLQDGILAAIVQDGFFAAIAAIGFACISHPPRNAYLWCALVAAAGHSVRFALASLLDIHIVAATAVAALLIGILAEFVAERVKIPAETCLFPALLPMIPGMYAYRTVQGLLLCLCHTEEAVFMKNFYMFAYNGVTCVFILLGMVVGANIPGFIFKRISHLR